MKTLKGFLTISFLFHIACDMAFGYEVKTHELLNTRISDSSTIDEYFHDELGFGLFETGENQGRIDNTFQGTLAIMLFKQGGVDEDSPHSWCYLTKYPRAYNHYHDPLRSWDDAGYTNPTPFWYSGISGIAYAQYNRLVNLPNLALLQCDVVAPNRHTWDNAYQSSWRG